MATNHPQGATAPSERREARRHNPLIAARLAVSEKAIYAHRAAERRGWRANGRLVAAGMSHDVVHPLGLW